MGLDDKNRPLYMISIAAELAGAPADSALLRAEGSGHAATH